MSNPLNPPAPAPCGSCPYRRDVPSGIWDESEYAKLPPYDRETAFQPSGVFLCHQQDGRLCAGWVATHDMKNSLALRYAMSAGEIDANDLDAIIDYTTTVPVFRSGLEAAAHGLKDVERPSREALKQIERLQEKAQARRQGETKEETALSGFEGIGDFDSDDPFERYAAHQAAKGWAVAGGQARPFTVVDTAVEPGENTPIIGRFRTEEEASKFIETLPDAESGRYGLDGPPE